MLLSCFYLSGWVFLLHFCSPFTHIKPAQNDWTSGMDTYIGSTPRPVTVTAMKVYIVWDPLSSCQLLLGGRTTQSIINDIEEVIMCFHVLFAIEHLVWLYTWIFKSGWQKFFLKGVSSRSLRVFKTAPLGRCWSKPRGLHTCFWGPYPRPFACRLRGRRRGEGGRILGAGGAAGAPGMRKGVARSGGTFASVLGWIFCFREDGRIFVWKVIILDDWYRCR